MTIEVRVLQISEQEAKDKTQALKAMLIKAACAKLTKGKCQESE